MQPRPPLLDIILLLLSSTLLLRFRLGRAKREHNVRSGKTKEHGNERSYDVHVSMQLDEFDQVPHSPSYERLITSVTTSATRSTFFASMLCGTSSTV